MKKNPYHPIKDNKTPDVFFEPFDKKKHFINPGEPVDNREDPNDFFQLTDEMISSIKKEVIPRIKKTYDICHKNKFERLLKEKKIDFDRMLFESTESMTYIFHPLCIFDADEFLELPMNDFKNYIDNIDKFSENDFNNVWDYSDKRYKLWNEKFKIDEKELLINLVIKFLNKFNW